MLSQLLTLSLLGPGCNRHKDEGTTADQEPTLEVPSGGGIGEISARRLSRDEFDNVLFDILGDDRRISSTFLPEDVIDPFDNQIVNQDPSAIVVTGLETLANDVAT